MKSVINGEITKQAVLRAVEKALDECAHTHNTTIESCGKTLDDVWIGPSVYALHQPNFIKLKIDCEFPWDRDGIPGHITGYQSVDILNGTYDEVPAEYETLSGGYEAWKAAEAQPNKK